MLPDVVCALRDSDRTEAVLPLLDRELAAVGGGLQPSELGGGCFPSRCGDPSRDFIPLGGDLFPR